MSVKKFKIDIGGDKVYDSKVKDYAELKDVQTAVQICGACGQLNFQHKPGPCTRLDKAENKYSDSEISEIVAAINRDVVTKIVENAKIDFLTASDSHKSDFDASKNNDKLAVALEKIAEVLNQQRQSTPQVTKVKPPPIWAKERFSDYKAEVQAWKNAHPGEPFVKYSEFINELKRNKSKPGLSDYVSSIVIDKTRIDKTVESVLQVLEEKYELTKKEKFSTLWNLMKSFKPSKSDSGEHIFSQIEKIEREISSLDVANNINYFLSTVLLNESHENDVLNEIEKRSIEDFIDSKEDSAIMPDLKKLFKRVKIEGKRETNNNAESEDSKTFFVKNSERSRYGSWKNSRDFKDFSRTNSNNWRTRSGNRWRKSESASRPRSQSNRSSSGFRSMEDISQVLSQVLKKLKNLEEKQDKIAKSLDDKVVNSNFIETDFEEEDWSDAKLNIYFTKDIEEVNEMVVDCGAPKTLIGERYLFEYLKNNNLELHDLNLLPCKQKFKFGPSQVYLSVKRAEIPIVLKCKDRFSKQSIFAYVIQAEVPFLLGLDSMKCWRILMDMENEELIFRELDIEVKMVRNNGGHLIVPLEKVESWSTTDTVLYMKTQNEVCSLEQIKKVHINTNHKSEINLLHAYKQANLLTQEVRDLIKKVCQSCSVCQRFKKSQKKPRVALPKVTDFNQVVTLDLKFFGEKCVLWMVDSFTRFIQGAVIKNKQAVTVIDAVQSIWCLRFGYPSRGFWADNGLEFQNRESVELMSKLGLKMEFGPTYSPWSNGINERNHYSADIIVKKALEMDRTLSLQKAVDLASWTHNTNVNILGYEPMRLVTGKSVNIPGVTVGNEATESLFDCEAVQKIMERHQEFIKRFREQEYSDKLKKAARLRASEINNHFYNEGDEVLYQEKDKKAWLGPVRVFCQKGREVYLFTNGNIRKVASCKVKPFRCFSSVVGNEEQESDQSKKVKLDISNFESNSKNDIDHFEADSSNVSVEPQETVCKDDSLKDAIGTYWMKIENNECYNQDITSYVVELPVHKHNTPEVMSAKESELKNLSDYGTFEEVQDIGQDRITSRWVITTKELHDGQKTKIKARLVARGFQEEVCPQSDSPTVLRESNKLFTAVAANSGFSIVSVDIRAAFLQSKELKRDVYVIPPKDIAKPGIIWKLKKPLYGLNDASRRFWLRLKEVFDNENLKTLPGDEAFYFKNEGGDLKGMVITHVDDFQIAGTDLFIDSLLDILTKTLTVSKVEKKEFRFTGIDIKQTKEGIDISMEDYANSIQEIQEIRKEKKDSLLTKTEMKLFRKYVGKLNWLAENARPDIAIWALNLSKRNSQATIGDLKKVNQVVKKVMKRQSKVKFCVIGQKDDLVLHAVSDASYKSDGPSIGGNLIMLGSRLSKRVNPIYWKSKQISHVCHSAKEAETRSVMKLVDTAVYLSEQLGVLLYGTSKQRIPVKIYTDSKPLLDSISSTKQVEQKLLRNTMTDLKKKLESNIVSQYSWIETKAMTADILTKEGGDVENILEVVRSNIFRKANSHQNVVKYIDGEMLVVNEENVQVQFD